MSDYFVAPRLHEKRRRQCRKKKSLLHDDLDDDAFDHTALPYPVHALPGTVLAAIPPDQRVQLPHPLANPIVRNRYTTSADPRNCFTTFEYKVHGQHIIWDYNTGYVHLTGIWKALGNAKADILHLLDNAPELEPFLRRVRGGFLKIQGSWLAYDQCYRLAAKICWDIRYCLVPLFGARFLDDVLRPSDFGYGELKLNSYLPGDPNDKTSENKRKRKRKVLESAVKRPRAAGAAAAAADATAAAKPLEKESKPAAKRGRKPKLLTTPPAKHISSDEYQEMMLALDSLRKLKYAGVAHDCPSKPTFKAYRSFSLPNESAIASDTESTDDKLAATEYMKPGRPACPVPYASATLPSLHDVSPDSGTAYSHYHYASRRLMTPSPPMVVSSPAVLPLPPLSSTPATTGSAGSLSNPVAYPKHSMESLLLAATRLARPSPSPTSLCKYSLNSTSQAPATMPSAMPAPPLYQTLEPLAGQHCSLRDPTLAGSGVAKLPSISAITGKEQAVAARGTGSKMDIKGLIS